MYDLGMGHLRFEWRSAKAAANAKKHGIGFDEARSAFARDKDNVIRIIICPQSDLG